MNIEHLIKSKNILIVCGSGGVGKTTCSTALACYAAILGKKTSVLTIDPARRLMQSLGFSSELNQVNLTDPLNQILQQQQLFSSSSAQSLTAHMIEKSDIFDSILQSLNAPASLKEKISRNRFFKTFSQRFSGINEYMALEKLLSLSQKTDAEFIILDTPPTQNLLNFLNAPENLLDFFSEPFIKKFAFSWLTNSMQVILDTLTSLTNKKFLQDMQEFTDELFSLSETFKTRLKAVSKLLHHQKTCFLLVQTPSLRSQAETEKFYKLMQQKKLHFGGCLLNKGLIHLEKSNISWIEAQRQEQENFIQDCQQNAIPLLAVLPDLTHDIHCLEDLCYVTLAFNNDLFTNFYKKLANRPLGSSKASLS